MNSEARARSSHSRPTVRQTVTAGIVTLSLLAFGGFAAAPAFAADYPTWDDVKAAQSNESTKQTEIERISGLISALATETAAAQQLAEQRGAAYQISQATFDTASFKASELQAQADSAQNRADAAKRQAGQLAALMAKSGGSALSVNLLTLASDEADSLLYQLGAMSRLTGSSTDLHEQAEQHTNTAKSLTSQATVAAKELEALAAEAQKLHDVAVESQLALQTSLDNQLGKEAELKAQLSVLSDNRSATEADYRAGVAAREAARQPPSSPGSSEPSASGWANPFPGSFSSDEYGMRVNPVDGGYRLHAGIDLIYNSGTCGAPVYAAAGGQVTYSGYNGGFGNNVQINHGDGSATSYSHNSSLAVGIGQSVSAGQVIAYAGSTGNSTGCHVHFEVRVNGSTTDPRPFMANRGVGL